MREKVIISLGGSLIVPDKIDLNFLKSFEKIIRKFVNKYDFIITTGGGSVARNYINAAKELVKTSSDDEDWLGISATKINAQFVKTIFKDIANPKVFNNPAEKIGDYKITVASGYKPGCSTDNIAVNLAINNGIKKIINLTNTSHIYDKDPKKHKDAKKFEEIKWDDYIKIVGNEWKAGLSSPFDPIASKGAKEHDLKVIIADGKDLDNFVNILSNKNFVGTTISN